MALSQIVWMDGEILPLQEANINIFSPSVQYAHGGFEGIRFYDTERGPAIFRIQDHWKRFFEDTARELAMEIPYGAGDLTKAVIDLIKITGMREGYIRPSIVYRKPELGLHNFEQRKVTVAIVLASWQKKLTEDGIAVTISPVVRNHPASVNMRAKVSGYYQNSIRALRDAKQRGFQEALLLDYEGNIAEGSAENVFFVVRNVLEEKILVTPEEWVILPGVTRDTIVTLAEDAGYKVLRWSISPDDRDFPGYILEMFLCGTAMEILAITKIDDEMIGDGKKGEVTSHLSRLYSDVVRGRDARYLYWLTFVNP